MFHVTLSQFDPKRRERLERVVHKHSGGKLDHVAREALLSLVAAGQPQRIASYAEEHCAANALLECTLVGATAAVAKAEAA